MNDGQNAAIAAPDVDIRVLEGLDNFLGLRRDWDDLHERQASPQTVFQSHCFLRHWAMHYLGGSDRLYLICGSINGQLTMIWPLVLKRKLSVDVLTVMGAPIAQFSDVLLGSRAHASTLLDAGWEVLKSLPADIFLATNVRFDASLHSCLQIRQVELPGRTTAPFAALHRRVDGEKPGCAYTARERSNYRRRLRRAGEHGRISFHSIPPGAQASGLADKAIGFKQRSLLKKSLWSPTVHDPKFGLFFRAFTDDLDSTLRVSTVNCDDTEVGIALSFDSHGHTFGHVLATDPDTPMDGVGSLLVHNALVAAAARGSQVFDMLPPADEYKLRHADGETPVASFAHALTFKGRLYRDLYLRVAQPLAKTFARRLVSSVAACFLRVR